MPDEEKLVEELRRWVDEHPEEADIPHINMTTQREFTMRGILDELVREEEMGIAIVDEEVLEIKSEIQRWIGR